MPAGPLAPGWTRVDGRLVHHRSGGRPSPAGPVVLVHGLISGTYLLPLAERLAGRTTVAVPDLPGFGPTPAAERALDVEGLAGVLGAWLRASGLAGATVVGHSVGAQVVVRLAAEHPELVGRAVLTGPTGDPGARTAAHYGVRWARCWRHEPLDLHRLAAREALTLSPGLAGRTLRHAVAEPTAALLARVAAPTLVIRGEHDHLAPEAWCRAAAALLPDGRLATVAGASHTVHWAAPGETADLVLRAPVAAA